MSLSPIGAVSTTAIQRPDRAQMQARADKAMAPTAELLGMSTDDLHTALRDTSLAQLAEEKGVAREDLLASIEEGLQASPPPGTEGAEVDLAALAEQIADGQRPGGPGGPGGHGGPPPPPRDGAQGAQDAASLLNTDVQSLLTRLQSGGTDLAALLKGTSVSASSLSSTLGGLQLDTYA